MLLYEVAMALSTICGLGQDQFSTRSMYLLHQMHLDARTW